MPPPITTTSASASVVSGGYAVAAVDSIQYDRSVTARPVIACSPREQRPRSPEHGVEHIRGEASGGRVLLPQLNVSTPKQALEATATTASARRS
jgi:hypothetical protein